MKLFQQLGQVLFKKKTSLLAFFWQMLCRNSSFFYLGMASDFLFYAISDLFGVELVQYRFPIWTALLWFMNYIVTLVQFYRHFPEFNWKILYYVLLVLILIPQSSVMFFFGAFFPLWLFPFLMKFIK